MKKKIPTFKTDAEAERFVGTSDLTRYDLSEAKPVRFKFEPKRPRPKAMTPKSFDGVWDTIEHTRGAAENMKLRSALMIALENYIVAERLNETQAASRLGVTQPRMSDLMRGKINLFSLETLVNVVAAAGLHIEVRLTK